MTHLRPEIPGVDEFIEEKEGHVTFETGDEAMNWKFWKTKGTDNTETIRSKKLKKPGELPDAVGRKLIVDLKIDPDEVWVLRFVSRPSESQQGIHDFRLFHPHEATQAGLVVKDWHSLDDSPDLILYEGNYNKQEQKVDLLVTRKSAA